MIVTVSDARNLSEFSRKYRDKAIKYRESFMMKIL
jgi:hypothetical protein